MKHLRFFFTIYTITALSYISRAQTADSDIDKLFAEIEGEPSPAAASSFAKATADKPAQPVSLPASIAQPSVQPQPATPAPSLSDQTAASSAPSTSTPPATDAGAQSLDDLTLDLDSAPTVPTPSAPGQAEEVALPMDLPVIGTVNLIPFEEKDPDSGKTVSGLKVYVPSKGSQLNWGPLTIDQGELKLINNVPSYSARASLFGSAATLSIKKATTEKKAEEAASSTPKKKLPSFSKLTFGVQFEHAPTIEFIPGKKATLNQVDLVLTKNKPAQLIAHTTILGQSVTITFTIDKKGTTAQATLKNLAFASIIPALKNSAAESIQLTTVTLVAKNFTQKASYTLDGTADVSSLSSISNDEKSPVTLHGAYSKEEGGTFTLSAPSLTIPHMATVSDAKIIVTSKQNSTKVTLSGKATIQFASVGSFDTMLDATIDKKGIEFSSAVQQTIRFADIDIRNITIHGSTIKKTISLEGDGTVQGYTAKIVLEKKAQGAVAAHAELTEKEIKPFSSIPGVSQITLKDPRFTFEEKTTGYELSLSGTVNIYGLQLDGTVHLEKTTRGETVTLLTMQAPRNWKLSDGLSTLKGTLFDNIQLDQLTFIISSNDYHDADQDITYKKGMNFVSKTTLSGPLVPVADFTGTPQTTSLSLIGYIAPDPIESTFKASIPSKVTIKNNRVTLGKLELEIAGKPEPIFSLLTSLIVKPSDHDDPLTFTSRISFKGEPPVVSLAGTMQGFWSKPFGIPGIEIGNVAAQIGFGPSFPETGIPASIGVAGQMTLGSRHVAMALKIPIVGDVDTVLCGALDKLTVQDLLDTAVAMATTVSGRKIAAIPLPDIGIQNMKLYAAPKATSIGEINFEKGITARGVLFLPGFKAFGNVTVSQTGLIAQASCTEIKFGPSNAPLLLVSRAKDDKTFFPSFAKASADAKAMADKTTDKPSSTSVAPASTPDQSSSAPATPTAQTAPDDLDLSSFVDAVDSLDSLDAAATPDALAPEQQDSLKSARSADVACAPDNTLLSEFNGPTMHIVASMEQDLSKQGVLVSGLFKIVDIFEEGSYFRMDKDGIEFDFYTTLGKALYQGKPLLSTKISGNSLGNLSQPESLNFSIELDFQQYLLSYVKEQTVAAIKQAKANVSQGVAQATSASNAALDQANKNATAGIKDAQAKVQKAKDTLASIDQQIDKVKSTMRQAIEDARKQQESLDQDIEKLKNKIADKQNECS